MTPDAQPLAPAEVAAIAVPGVSWCTEATFARLLATLAARDARIAALEQAQHTRQAAVHAALGVALSMTDQFLVNPEDEPLHTLRALWEATK